MFQTLVMGLSAFTGINADLAANRKYFDAGVDQAAMRLYVTSCLAILIASSLAGSLLLLAAKGYLSEWLGLSVKWLLFALIVSVMICLMRLRLGQWQVRERPLPYGVFQVARSLANVSLSLGIVILITTSAEGRILGYGLAALSGGAVAMLLLRIDGLIGLRCKREYIRDAVAFGAPLIPHVAGMFLILGIDRIIINAELGLKMAGIYMVAVQFSMAVGMPLDAFYRAYTPWLYRKLKEAEEGEKIRVVKITYLVFLVLTAVAALGFWLGPAAITIVAGSGYEAAGHVVGWLVLAQCLHGMYMMAGNYISYSKRTGIISSITIISGILNVMLLFVLIGAYGLVGAGMAVCCAMLLQFLMTWRLAHALQPMPWAKAIAG